MKEVFRDRDFTRVGYHQSILAAEGILTHVKNRDLVTLMTDIPIPDFFPTLYVVGEENYEEAIEVLEQ